MCGLVPLSSCADSFATNSIITKMELAQREHQVWASKHSSRVIDPSYSISCAVRERATTTRREWPRYYKDLCAGTSFVQWRWRSRDLVGGKQKKRYVHIKIGRRDQKEKKHDSPKPCRESWKWWDRQLRRPGTSNQVGRPPTATCCQSVPVPKCLVAENRPWIPPNFIKKSIALKICVIFY